MGPNEPPRIWLVMITVIHGVAPHEDESKKIVVTLGN
jgi:hypothetical protein